MRIRASLQPCRGRSSLAHGLLHVVIGLPTLGLLVMLALYSLPGARHLATPELVKTVRIVPGASASLVSPESDVTVEFEAGSVDVASVATYRSESVWDIPDLPLGFVATPRVFELSITGKDKSVVPESPGKTGFLLKPALLIVALLGDEAAAAGLDAHRIVIHRMDAQSGEWAPLATEVDFESSRASSRTESLGLFALGIRWTSNHAAVDQLDVLAGTYSVSPVSVQTPFQIISPTDAPTPTLTNLHQPQGTAIPVSGPVLVPDEPTRPASTAAVQTASQETRSPQPVQEVSTLIPSPAAVLYPTPTSTPIPPQSWELEEVHVSGGTVRVFVRILEQGLFAVSLDGMETEETRTSLPYQEYVFRRVMEGEHRVKVWTPGPAPYEENIEIMVYAPTPTPAELPTPAMIATPTPEPRYRLFINQVQVQQRQTGMVVADGSVNISPPPQGDGRYKLGEEVTIMASPRSGWLLAWGGIDRFDRSFARVRMVADRLVSVHISPPSTSPSLPTPSHSSIPIP